MSIESSYIIPDLLAERARKIGDITLYVINQISKMQRINDSNADYIVQLDMLAEFYKGSK